LSTRYKCGLCGTKTCPQCFEIKKDDHECQEENLKTAEVLRKETKACPSCGTIINKIDGCFGFNTIIPLYNGKTKYVQDIVIGDELIGDDNNIRKVLNVFSGRDMMYSVSQAYGIGYEVNSKHELVLINPDTNEIVEIKAEDYYNSSKRYYGIGCQSKLNKNIVSIQRIGINEYYGFELDKNRRFILRDGTVCKNCNQMWCTSCKKGFDWRTRKIIGNERIHNPHYFQWLQENNNDTQQRERGCEGLPSVAEVLAKLRDDHKRKHYILVYRNLVHMQDVVLPTYAVDQDNIFTRNFSLRVKYLNKSITDEEWKRKLQQMEKSVLKRNEIYMAMEMLCNTGTDIFRQMVREEDIWKIPEILGQFETLRSYYNKQVNAIHRHYGCVVPTIDFTWAIL